ncbi:DUF6220 domain-containing protein [Sulfitobacter sp.]|uniref:DUF6220 domain-containing protein n=1 Tax=Sulfitobacter sp. TaxID=1903071 RepID=UPI00300333C4
MAVQKHDRYAVNRLRASAFFTWLACTLPAAICAQFLLAGQALLGGLCWSMHGVVGGLIGLPVVALVAMAISVSYLRGLAW